MKVKNRPFSINPIAQPGHAGQAMRAHLTFVKGIFGRALKLAGP